MKKFERIGFYRTGTTGSDLNSVTREIRESLKLQSDASAIENSRVPWTALREVSKVMEHENTARLPDLDYETETEDDGQESSDEEDGQNENAARHLDHSDAEDEEDSESDDDPPPDGVINVYEIDLRGFAVLVNHIKAEDVSGYKDLGKTLHVLLMNYLHHEIRQHAYVTVLFPCTSHRILYLDERELPMNILELSWEDFIGDLRRVVAVIIPRNIELVPRLLTTYFLLEDVAPFDVSTYNITSFATFFRALHIHLSAFGDYELDDYYNSSLMWNGLSIHFKDVDDRPLFPPFMEWNLSQVVAVQSLDEDIAWEQFFGTVFNIEIV